MADIVEFISKNVELNESNVSNIKVILEEILAQADKIKDLSVFILDNNDDYILFNSLGLSMPDKAMLIQLIENDIQNELNQTTELE